MIFTAPVTRHNVLAHHHTLHLKCNLFIKCIKLFNGRPSVYPDMTVVSMLYMVYLLTLENTD